MIRAVVVRHFMTEIECQSSTKFVLQGRLVCKRIVGHDTNSWRLSDCESVYIYIYNLEQGPVQGLILFEVKAELGIVANTA